MQKLISLLLVILFITLLASCKKDKEEEEVVIPTLCEVTNSQFNTQVLPIFQANCAVSGCHDGTDPDNPTLFDNYANIKGNIEADQALFLTAINFSGSDDAIWMPRPQPDVFPSAALKLPQSMIDKIECWIDRGMPND
jgi:hypothetical protein